MDWASLFEFTIYDALFIVVILGFFFYWLMKTEEPLPPPPKQLELLPLTDMTVEELKKYDGVKNQHILFGLNGTIYDVSKGINFYGPGKAYGKLAGHDATRALGTMNQNTVSDEWDDHEGMTNDEKETANEWETQFKFKYPTVGRLVKSQSDKLDYQGKTSFIRGNDAVESVLSDKKTD
ncbi:unnamed protein product [Caenorhabditis angaria]|uniref:Cytochrome b5 heme-binding domain-containing protein n=1 Tax=Caenorhabditis angaria TaxID=860376 RepID=A0A9P1J1A7_9PELO|nr:unnamed protein product [Caenorhabditis angaria]